MDLLIYFKNYGDALTNALERVSELSEGQSFQIITSDTCDFFKILAPFSEMPEDFYTISSVNHSGIVTITE